MSRLFALLLISMVVACPLRAALPPAIELSAADRTELEAGLQKLRTAIDATDMDEYGGDPDVEILYKTVLWALRDREFFEPSQIALAKDLVQQAVARAENLMRNQWPWTSQTGVVIRGFRSEVDRSVQPYVVVVPAGFKPKDGAKKWPMQMWVHDLRDAPTELAFIQHCLRLGTKDLPPDTIVCHCFARGLATGRLAADRDWWQLYMDVEHDYSVDSQKCGLRGFGTGGMVCLQLAVHYPNAWAAIALAPPPVISGSPLASASKKKNAPWWEEGLRPWSDPSFQLENLHGVKIVTYSGENDPDRRNTAAWIAAARKFGLKVTHVIGAESGRTFHAEAQRPASTVLNEAVATGNVATQEAHFVTYSIIHSAADHLFLHELEQEWKRSEIHATPRPDGVLEIHTKNVRKFYCALPHSGVVIDHENLRLRADKGMIFEKQNGHWDPTITRRTDRPRPTFADGFPRIKDCNRTGPIDHAFGEEFIFVRPTGRPWNDAVGAWSKAEMERAIAEWRRVCRADVRVMDDDQLTNAETLNAHLILWGDPQSNSYLGEILKDIPLLRWNKDTLIFGGYKLNAAFHVPILIYPNVRTGKYLILNSGPTFRTSAESTPRDLTPKLPDWALVDIRTPPGPKWPGKIVDAGFFDEDWQLPK
jgi:hypothetical protein